MAEFEVTLSSMTDAANNIRSQLEEFHTQAENTYNAARTLSEGWEGDSYQEFVENMSHLHDWMGEMEDILTTYAQALDTAAQKYGEADKTSANAFNK